jgi:hypothetical protein
MSIEARLERLEKQMQFYKRLVVVLALVIVAGVSMGQTSDYEDITCRSLTIVDKTGGERIKLINGSDGGRIELVNKSGGEGIRLSSHSDGGRMIVWGKKTWSTLIGHSGDGQGFLKIFSPAGRALVNLSATGTGGFIGITNKTGEEAINMFPDDYGNGRIGIWNRKGKGRVYDSQQ